MTASAAVIGRSPSDLQPVSAGLSLPITHFSIPLGLAGLGAAWTAAADVLGAPALPGDLAYGGAALLWTAFLVAHVVGTGSSGPSSP